MVVVECLGHGIKVGGGSQDDKDVKDLVRTAPDVHLAGEASLWPTGLYLSVFNLYFSNDNLSLTA